VTLDKSGRLFVHDCAIRVRQLPKEIVDVLIVGECWRDHENKNDKRFFHLNLPSMDQSARQSVEPDYFHNFIKANICKCH
jgi:hypothetical protein